MNDDLFEAYHRTSFSSDTPLGPVHLRVDQRNEILFQLLQRNAATSWAYVTAFNPGSQPLANEENLQRQRQLEDLLLRDGLTFFSGAGVGDDHQWPPEVSVLVFGIGQPRAIELAREFGQNAILAGGADAVPRLVDCRLENGT
jgi:hypothetical protein